MFIKKAITLSTLSTLAAASNNVPRQASDAESFSSAAADLISSYIPQDVYTSLVDKVGSAASSAGVTGAAASDILFSVMTAGGAVPTWFSEAIPPEYWTQVEALDSAVGSLNPVTTTVAKSAEETTYVTTVSGTEVTTSGYVMSVTTTDENGSTITAPVIVATNPASGSSSDSGVNATGTTITTTDQNGNTVTSTGFEVATTTTDDKGNESTSTKFTASVEQSQTATTTSSSTNHATPTAAAGRGVAAVAGIIGIAAVAL